MYVQTPIFIPMMATDISQVLPVDTASLDVSLLGAVLGGVAYGIASTLYCICCYLLLKLLKKDRQKKYYRLIIYVSLVWVAFTITFVSDVMTLWGYIHKKDTEFLVNGLGYVGLYAGFAGIRMIDTLLVWRCFVVLRSHSLRYRILVGAIPLTLLLAYTAFGIPVLIVKTRILLLINIEFVINFVLNIAVTAIISFHLCRHERSVRAHFPGNQGSTISRVISMLIESAAIVVVFDLFFIIPFAVGSKITNLPLQLLGYVQAIAAYLTIFRVAQGKAWVHDYEVHSMSPMSFRTDDVETASTNIST